FLYSAVFGLSFSPFNTPNNTHLCNDCFTRQRPFLHSPLSSFGTWLQLVDFGTAVASVGTDSGSSTHTKTCSRPSLAWSSSTVLAHEYLLGKCSTVSTV
ncbi:hypothetical protein KI387_042187, partial [Taxus chinensis]